MKVDAKEFVRVWKDSPTAIEAAKKLGMTYGSVRTYAWMLRSMGFDVPPKGTKAKAVKK